MGKMNEDYTQVRGDSKPMNDKGGATAGDFTNSLGDASKSDLSMGYTKGGGIAGDTKSDGMDYA